ncbi:MAG: cytochrome c family protein [Myxococcota bacterium]
MPRSRRPAPLPGIRAEGNGSSGDTPEYRAICSTCHNPTHSLGFDYANLPSPHLLRPHRVAPGRRACEAARVGRGPNRSCRRPRTAGPRDACQSCHPAEFETWQASPHARAVATLEAKGKAADADCLRCHTTAWDKPGGFPAGADVASHADLARVGCESCHGPGGAQVGDTTRKVGTILSLGDKCDSCVIPKVRGSCHDAANDPGFEFEVEARIEAQRHGTTPSAATRAQQEGS